MFRTTTVATLLAASLGACSSDSMETSTTTQPACAAAAPVPALTLAEKLRPPAGATLLTRLRGEGTQIYVCQAGATAGYAWTLKAPEAKLIDSTCAQVGTHFGGPTWQSSVDGSSVVGAKVADDLSPAGAIPWLRLTAKSTAGQGMFSTVSTILRTNTVGGLAPSSGCDAGSVGQEQAIPYTADYYFYTGGATP